MTPPERTVDEERARELARRLVERDAETPDDVRIEVGRGGLILLARALRTALSQLAEAREESNAALQSCHAAEEVGDELRRNIQEMCEERERLEAALKEIAADRKGRFDGPLAMRDRARAALQRSSS